MPVTLTPEERRYILDTRPHLLAAIEADKPEGRAYLAFVRKTMQTPDVPPEAVSAWFGYPTDITRISPFFPLSKVEQGKDRKYFENTEIVKSNWGSLKYTGPQLGIFEEDVFTALFVLISNKHKKINLSGGDDDKLTYTYTGSASEILKVMISSSRHPSSADYKRLLASLNRMMSAVIQLTINVKKNGDATTRKVYMRHLLDYADWDEDSKTLSIRVNPTFYDMYVHGQVTYLDAIQRYNLSGDVTKALYRFVMSHRDGFTGNYNVVAAAINMNIDQPVKTVRRKLKLCVNELVKNGLLTEDSGFLPSRPDIIQLKRIGKSLSVAQQQSIPK